MNGKTSKFLFFSIALLLSVVLVEPVCFAVTVEEAGVVLDQAEQDLSSAFGAVADAGESGANVEGLLERLSVAGDYLSRARAAYTVGNYETAYSDSVACSNSLYGVSDDAMQLLMSTENARSEKMWFAVAESGVGLALLFVFGLLGWKFLNKWYRKQVLDMKPVMEAQQ